MMKKNWQYFYRHLMQNDRILPIGVGDPSLLANTGRKILKMIESNDSSWRAWVPDEAHAMVERKLKR